MLNAPGDLEESALAAALLGGRGPHGDTAGERKTWEDLVALVRRCEG